MKVEVSSAETLRQQLEKLPTRTAVTPRELVEKHQSIVLSEHVHTIAWVADDALRDELCGDAVPFKPRACTSRAIPQSQEAPRVPR
jgi:hypothetical protein